jgi:hypothetical protein
VSSPPSARCRSKALLTGPGARVTAPSVPAAAFEWERCALPDRGGVSPLAVGSGRLAADGDDGSAPEEASHHRGPARRRTDQEK